MRPKSRIIGRSRATIAPERAYLSQNGRDL